MKFCKDCKHYRHYRVIPDFSLMGHDRCVREGDKVEVNLVTGETTIRRGKVRECSPERHLSKDGCGKEGKYWEAKDK